jgi:hypothetical protein
VPLGKDGGLNRELYTNWHHKILKWRQLRQKFGMKIRNINNEKTFVAMARNMYEADVLARRGGYVHGGDEAEFDDNNLPDLDVDVDGK